MDETLYSLYRAEAMNLTIDDLTQRAAELGQQPGTSTELRAILDEMQLREPTEDD